MNTPIPSAADVSARLTRLSRAEVQRLADASGVPFHTLLKIRSGETSNPGIETVRLFAPHLDAFGAATNSAPGALEAQES